MKWNVQEDTVTIPVAIMLRWTPLIEKVEQIHKSNDFTAAQGLPHSPGQVQSRQLLSSLYFVSLQIMHALHLSQHEQDICHQLMSLRTNSLCCGWGSQRGNFLQAAKVTVFSSGATNIRRTWTCWSESGGGPQRGSQGWSSSPMKTGWESWGCSAWRREGSGEPL